MGIPAIRALQKSFGNTLTTTLWRYVEHSEDLMFGGISCHPHRPPSNAGAPFRYFIRSARFSQQFSNVREVDVFAKMQSYCEDRRGGPLGSAEVLLRDDAGRCHVFHLETFFNQYDALTLGVHRRTHDLIIGT